MEISDYDHKSTFNLLCRKPAIYTDYSLPNNYCCSVGGSINHGMLVLF